MDRHFLTGMAAVLALGFVYCASRQSMRGDGDGARTNDSAEAAGYRGVDERGVPHYATSVSISSADSMVLHQAYGIEDPHRLYVSDSTEEGILKYDTAPKRCLTCYVNSYRVGYESVRRPGESWEEVERRVKRTPARVFKGKGPQVSTSTADLDPDVRPVVETMLRDARAAGFRLTITATYRSPLREAYLMSKGGGRTYTLTSNHSYGRALDIDVGDGNAAHRRTREQWIAFRRWVTQYRTPTGTSFRVLGPIERTWDWPHVELPSRTGRFDTIDDAVERARACLAPNATVSCNFPPHVPPHLDRSLVQ